MIRQGLLGGDFALLKVEAFVRLGAGQEVFPLRSWCSTRVVAKRAKEQTPLSGGRDRRHALPEDWQCHSHHRHLVPGAEELGPIAVEPYGSVTSRGTAYRQPKEKLDFYNLLDGWMLKDNLPAVDQQHYVMATLVRGGVFGEAD